MFRHIFESTTEKTPDIKYIKFEIYESNRRKPEKYGIRSIPSVLEFRNGELVEARTGLMDEETLMDWIRELKGS